MTNELIIFKKDTDAPGSNRGFVYQYLKTLLLWLNNYKQKKQVTIYCEVDDDIKEINLMEQTVRFTQLKCYSSALNINSEEIKKSFYNYFLLHLIYEDYEGEYVFETNTHISSRDTVIEKWITHQGKLHTNQQIQNLCIYQTRQILKEVFVEEKEYMEKAIKKKISTRIEKNRVATSENKNLLLEIETLDKELVILQNLSVTFEEKIDDDLIMSNFTNRISWVFENTDAVESINVLKENINEVLKDISKDKNRIDLYFGRLLSEINFKAIKEKRELRFLNNKLLEKILSETDDVIHSGIDIEILKRFGLVEIKLDQGFTSLNKNVSDSEYRIREDINSLGTRLESQLNLTTNETEYHLFEMPNVEPEEVQEFIQQENNEQQSKLEMKFHKIEGLGEEIRNNLLTTATELRCRYLLYLQGLKFQNFHREYDEIKKLEKKIEGICNDAVLELHFNSEITSAKFYLAFKKELALALRDFNKQVKIKRFVVDTEVVYGQMFHMAAKCFLRWHREG